MPEFIITDLCLENVFHNLLESFNHPELNIQKDISIEIKLGLKGNGDFSEYVNGTNIDHKKLMADLFSGQIEMKII